MKKKARVELNPVAGGLNAAFAELSLEGLPSGPAAPVEVAPVAPVRKPGRVVLRRETAHRGGKAVLVVHDFATHISEAEIDVLAQELRAACGCGGTRHGREIELQGEPVAKVRTLLEGRGYQVAGVR